MDHNPGLNNLVRPIGIWLIPLTAVFIKVNRTEPEPRPGLRTAGLVPLVRYLVQMGRNRLRPARASETSDS